MTKPARAGAPRSLVLGLAAALSISGQAPAADCPVPDAATGGPVNAHTRYLETTMLPAIADAETPPRTLAERMAAWQVPGVTIAVIRGGKLDWARGWGVRDVSTCAPVTPETAFQAASISKPVFAMVVMKLAEAGKLDIDADIATLLKSWTLPPAPAISDAPISLRQLLSHTAGLTLHGFPGYAPDETLPTLIDTLNGEPIPRSFAPMAGGAIHSEGVVRAHPPGTRWQYSGGGYVLAQRVVEDLIGEPLERTAQRLVLRPLHMKRSSYAQPPTQATLADAASGHANGEVVPGGYHLYPQHAAAGLWTTPTDLAHFLIDVQRSAAGEQPALLHRASAQAMTTAGLGDWAVGFGVRGTGADQAFHHGGANAGFRNWATMFTASGNGVIVMTNSDTGGALADEIMRAVATDYGWTAMATRPLRDVAVPRETLERYAGHYAAGPVTAHVSTAGGKLFARTDGPLPERMVMLTPTRFRTVTSGIDGEFESADDGTITGIRVLAGAPTMTLLRTPAPADTAPPPPILLRGSMNDWGTTTAFAPAGDARWTATATLAAGDYQFKLGSEDWNAVNLGADGLLPIAVDGSAMPLTPQGANILLKIEAAGTYRFELALDAAGGTALRVVRADD